MLAVVMGMERGRQMRGIFWKLDHGDLVVDWIEEVRERDGSQMTAMFGHEAAGGGQ